MKHNEFENGFNFRDGSETQTVAVNGDLWMLCVSAGAIEALHPMISRGALS